MSTVRGVKDRRFKFVQLLNCMFEDVNLSLKAKGFIGFCLTKTKDWVFHIDHLISVLKEGDKAIYAVINECIDNGYAYRYQGRDEKGRALPVEFIISDSKEEIMTIKKEFETNDKFKKILPNHQNGEPAHIQYQPLPCFRQADNRETDKGEPDFPKETESSIYSNTDYSNKEQQQEQQAAAVSFNCKTQTKSKIYFCLEKVEIPIEDKIQITERNNEEIVKNAIEWATHPKNPPTRCLAASIKFACLRGLSGKNFEVKKQSVHEKIKEKFKNGEKYNQAECYLNEKALGFQRGMKHEEVKIDSYLTWDKVKNLCKSFGIDLGDDNAMRDLDTSDKNN